MVPTTKSAVYAFLASIIINMLAAAQQNDLHYLPTIRTLVS